MATIPNHWTLRMIIVLAGAFILVGTFSGPGRAETVNALNPLFETLSADHFEEVKDWERAKTPEQPLSRVTGVFIGRSAGGTNLGTVVHLSSPGYAGPVEILVAFDPSGRILKVKVFRHSETDCHVTGMTKGNFLDQFIGVAMQDTIRLLVGFQPSRTGDIQAMTSGTVTSRAVSEAVAEARIVYYRWRRSLSK